MNCKLSRVISSVFCALCIVVLTSGCEDSTRAEATGKGQIRGINAVVDSPDLTFLIEEVSIGDVPYKAATNFDEYDDLTYNFNFDRILTSSSTRIARELVDVMADMEYTLVLNGPFSNPSVSVWAEEIRTFAETDTVFEADFIHFAATQGAVDIYFATAGTLPVAGQAIGTVSNGERIAFQEFSGGDYEVIITPGGDPNTVLFQSNTIASLAAARVTIAVFDPDPSITADIAVNLVSANGGSTPLSDVNSPTQLRLYHAAFATGAVDGFVNDDFTNPVFPNVDFSQLSGYITTDSENLPTTVTPVGNIGAPILARDVAIAANTRKTILFGGDAASPIFFDLVDDGRPVATFPSARITNMAVNAGAINIYLLEAGTTISAETGFLFANIPFPFSTGFFPPDLGALEMTVTLSGSLTPISAPLPISFQNGDIVDIVVLDTVDPAVVELMVFDSVPAAP